MESDDTKKLVLVWQQHNVSILALQYAVCACVCVRVCMCGCACVLPVCMCELHSHISTQRILMTIGTTVLVIQDRIPDILMK